MTVERMTYSALWREHIKHIKCLQDLMLKINLIGKKKPILIEPHLVREKLVITFNWSM